MKKTALFFLIGFLVIALSSCGKKTEEANPEKIPTVKGVEGETLKASAPENYYEAVGTVRAKITSVLSSRTMGQVVALHVRECDRVKSGQLLIEIDDQRRGQTVGEPNRGTEPDGRALDDRGARAHGHRGAASERRAHRPAHRGAHRGRPRRQRPGRRERHREARTASPSTRHRTTRRTSAARSSWTSTTTPRT